MQWLINRTLQNRKLQSIYMIFRVPYKNVWYMYLFNRSLSCVHLLVKNQEKKTGNNQKKMWHKSLLHMHSDVDFNQIASVY